MGTISRVTTWSTGDTLTASDLNGEFDNILSTANGSINADNLGVTAGIASALKAVVLDSNKDFADGTGSNQIRNLTISGSLKIGTTFLPDASGGADLGSATLEWGDLYIADDKYIKLGSDQNINIGYDETTTDSLKIAATEGAALAITLMADEGDDAGDEWKLNVADGGTITLGNDIASAGTFVTHLTLTPHATVASSTLALAGGLTVAGTAGITGVATVGGLTIGSAVINEAELETIDGVTAGTVAASKAVVVDSNKDIGTFRNITLNGTLSDGNYTFDTSGNVTGLGTVGSGAITSTGVVTGTGFTIGSAAINEAELETIDGVTAGTVAASKAVVVDSNKDISSFRNVTLTGELDAATGDFSGDVDVDGTLEADAITLNGTALGSLYSPIAGSSSIVTVGTIGTGTWQGTAVASAYLDADTAHLSTIQTFSGAKTFSAAAQFSSTVTVGVNDTGYDVKFFGATAGSSLLWDESADDLILTNAGIAVGSDATGDLYYRNASGFLARLGVGDDGQVLTSTGTLPNWEAASGGGGHTIQEEGSDLTQRANLNFVGAGVTATDDSGNDATKITVSATGASMPFIKSDGTTSDPIALTSAAVGESLVSDTSPQLGGNLDVLARSITTTTTNGDIAITPHGTGKVILDTNLTFDGTTLAVTGALTMANAAGPTIVNEAATATNPTLIPNKAEVDTGYGWAAADTLTVITGGAERMRIGSTGNVGIGETSPDTHLHVNGAYSSAQGTAKLQSTDNDASKLTFWNKDTSPNSASRRWGFANNQSAFGDFQIQRGTSSTGDPTTAVMTFDSSGNVGIGTTAPTAAARATIQGATNANTWHEKGFAGDGTSYGPLIEAGSNSSDYCASFNDRNSAVLMRIRGDGTVNVWDGTGIADADKVAHISPDGGHVICQPGAYAAAVGTVNLMHQHASAPVLVPQTTHASYTGTSSDIRVTRAATSAYSFQRMYSGGTADLEFNLRGDGQAYADGSWNASGADYQEWFESADGTEYEIGKAVVLDGDKVRVYNADTDSVDNIMGITRPQADNKNSAVVGNTAWNHWTEKYLTDDWGVYLREDVEVTEWEERESDGATPIEVYGEVSTISFKTSELPTEVHELDSEGTPTGEMVAFELPEWATTSTVSERKLNPAYSGPLDKVDPNYVPREDRVEWNLIGMLGQVQIKANEPTNPRWIKMKNISDAVEMWMIR